MLLFPHGVGKKLLEEHVAFHNAEEVMVEYNISVRHGIDR
jgi:hypothetical protein